MEPPGPPSLKDRAAQAVVALDRARRGVALYLAVVLVLSAASFLAAERILSLLVRLLGRRLVAYGPADAFLALASTALYCGVTLSLPVAAWMLWRFLTARWRPAWRPWGAPVVLLACLLFAGGLALGYFILLPAGVAFLVGFESPGAGALISAPRFVSFCGTILLALGFAFEAPLAAYFLARLGWLRPPFFRRRWRHAVLFCTVAAAVITPTPDVYNMTLMALPLLAIYFVCFVVVWAVDRRRRPSPLP